MRLGVTTFGCDGGRSGIDRYVRCLLEAMARTAAPDEMEILAHRRDVEYFVPRETSYHSLPGVLRSPVLDIAWHQVALGPLTRSRGYDVLFLPSANRRIGAFSPCPTVGTYHDGGILHVKEKYGPARRFYLTQLLPRLVRRLDHVLTVSEATKRDLVDLLGVASERITVTPLAADRERYRPRDPQVAMARVHERHGLSSPYLLYVSRLEHPSKNHVRLFEAFARARARHGVRHELVLAGSDWSGAAAVRAAAAASPVSGSIRLLGFVPDEALPDLYSASDGLLFPSLFEGFGLPLLEAMSSGLPVATSNRSSLPEVAGDAAIYFDPFDVEAMAEAIARLSFDRELRVSLVARGLARAAEYSWEKTAAATWRVLRSVS